MAKKVLVASGTSQNKMKFAEDTIRQICAQKGVEVEVTTANIYDVNIDSVKPDVIVIIGPNKFNYNYPRRQRYGVYHQDGYGKDGR